MKKKFSALCSVVLLVLGTLLTGSLTSCGGGDSNSGLKSTLTPREFRQGQSIFDIHGQLTTFKILTAQGTGFLSDTGLGEDMSAISVDGEIVAGPDSADVDLSYTITSVDAETGEPLTATMNIAFKEQLSIFESSYDLRLAFGVLFAGDTVIYPAETTFTFDFAAQTVTIVHTYDAEEPLVDNRTFRIIPRS